MNSRCHSMGEFLSPNPLPSADDISECITLETGAAQPETSARAYRSVWRYLKKYGFQLSIQDIASRDMVADIVNDAVAIHLAMLRADWTIGQRSHNFRKCLQRCAMRAIRRDGKFKVETDIKGGLDTLAKAVQTERLILETKKVGQRKTNAEMIRDCRNRKKLARQTAGFMVGNDEIYRSVAERAKTAKQELREKVATLSPEAQAKFAKLGKRSKEKLSAILQACKVRGRAAAGASNLYAGLKESEVSSIIAGMGIIIREDINGESFAYRAETTIKVKAIVPTLETETRVKRSESGQWESVKEKASNPDHINCVAISPSFLPVLDGMSKFRELKRCRLLDVQETPLPKMVDTLGTMPDTSACGKFYAGDNTGMARPCGTYNANDKGAWRVYRANRLRALMSK